jgi:hypothetical protein
VDRNSSGAISRTEWWCETKAGYFSLVVLCARPDDVTCGKKCDLLGMTAEREVGAQEQSISSIIDANGSTSHATFEHP